MFNEKMLKVLACPEDKGELLFIDSENILYNPRLQKAYSIDSGIALLLPEDAVDVDGARHSELMKLVEL